MVAPLYSNPRLADFVLSEAEGFRSRDNVVVTQTGVEIKSGTVVSKLTATGKYVVYDDVGTDGSEVAAGILYTHLPAFTGDAKAVVFNTDCEVRRGALIGLNTGGEADLRTLGIKVRGTAGLAGVSTPAL